MGWEVADQVEEADEMEGPPLQELEGTSEEREALVLERLKAVSEQERKRALILYTSHVGGHQYAGNVVVSLQLS